MKIKAITTWQNGQEKLGTEFNLSIVNDNLIDSATFYYNIYSEEISHIDNNIKIIDSPAQKLLEGNLYITGQDYIDWGKNQDINYAAYILAANKLNLQLLP